MHDTPHTRTRPFGQTRPTGLPRLTCRATLLTLLLLGAVSARAVDAPPSTAPVTEREILVPFEELSLLLENEARRVLLPRREYEELRAKALKQQETAPPAATLLTSADYTIKVGQERAEITGTLHLAALDARLRAVTLDVAGVGLRTAQLDKQSAPLGQAADGRLELFVEGVGDHTLELAAVTPLQTTAASQNLTFRVPMPPASRLHLTVPGDVELKSGAPVVTRVFDEKAAETRFELLPQPGQLALVFTLNSRLKRKDRVVTARSVLITEVTQACEKLHATVSFDVLHRAVDDFKLTLPAAFEITEVRSPDLARWVVRAEGGRNVIEITLREAKTGPVVLGISALRTAPPLTAWSFPKLEPQEVTGDVAVVGVLAESRLEVEALTATQLIPVDSSVLQQAMPASALVPDPGRPPLRAVAAFYAPSADFALTAAFRKPPATLRVTTNLLLILKKSGLELKGGVAMLAEQEKCFALDLAVPAGWDVTAVTTEDNRALPFERYAAAVPEPARIHISLPRGVPPGQQQSILFQARLVPGGWLDSWATRELSFPAFAVRNASRDIGAVAVHALDDLRVRPVKLEGLTPLNENEKSAYGLAGVETSLAYRYDAPPYAAALAVERITPRVTAESFSFLRLERDALNAHLEVHYTVEQARHDRFTLRLPASTPLALAIHGIGDTVVKEFSCENVADTATAPAAAPQRRWTVQLASPATGVVKIAVDFQQRLEAKDAQELLLPLPAAEGVAYQSGFLAVEGHAELDVDVLQHPRKVDIGELVDAQYQPGPRLLGAYGFTDLPPAVNVRLHQHNVCALPPAIIQRAEIASLLSANGVAESAARYLLLTKALFLEVRLPAGGQLWAVTLDGKPARPQSEDGRILLDLPAGTAGQTRDLQVVFEAPVAPLGFLSTAALQAPTLVFHEADRGAGGTVPAMDLQWTVYTPTGFELLQTAGSVVPAAFEPPPMAAALLLRGLWAASGGVSLQHGLLSAFLLSTGGLNSSIRMHEVVSGKKQVDYLGGAAPATAPAADEEAVLDIKNLAAAAVDELKMQEKVMEAPKAMKIAEAEGRIDDSRARRDALQVLGGSNREHEAAAKRKAVEKKAAAVWALEGARSLTIDLAATGEPVLFRSLGEAPEAKLTLANERRMSALTWAVALSVLLCGVALTGRSRRTRIGWVAIVLVTATVVPALPGLHTLTALMNGAFYAGAALLLYFPMAAFVRSLPVTRQDMAQGPHLKRPAAVATLLVLLLAAGLALTARAAEPARVAAPAAGTAVVVQGTPLVESVTVPDNALIVPYTAGADGLTPQDSGQVLIPYATFVKLWNQANPQDALATVKPPVPGACSGLRLTGRLDNADQLVLEGAMEFDVFGSEYAVVSLRLRNAVLANALLDGKPAAVRALAPAPPPPVAAARQSDEPLPAASTLVQLDVLGKGKHRLDLSFRIKLQRSGGWLVADAILPAMASTSLDLTVPTPGTEVRLKHVPDRLLYETESKDQVIRTALPSSGEFAVQWRPKVTEGQVDQTLTVSSGATLDLLEDGVQLAWALEMSFRRGEREFFSVELPAGYLVKKVEGSNVRGWDLRTEADRQRLDVNLLKPAKQAEAFTVSVWRPGALAAKAPQAVTVPWVNVEGAVRHTGVLAVRRSPALEVKTLAANGVRRVDQTTAPKPPALDSPLGVRPFEVYEFVKLPFALNLEVTSARPVLSGAAQSILRIAERERRLETRFALTVKDRPLYRVQIRLPADLELDRVTAPGVFEWAVAGEKAAPVLNVYMANGVQGEVAVVLEGRLGALGPIRELGVPQLSLMGAERQEGDLVVQADPAFEVQPAELKDIDNVLLNRVFTWLLPAQRGLARLALHQEGGDYSGRLILQPRQAEVHGYTVTNVRVTDRAVEETSLLDFTITTAGIQEVKFRLPKHLADARVSVPLLRQKTVTPVAASDEVQFTLELQDQVMGQLRVLVEHDRLLTGEKQRIRLPAVDTGRTDRQYLAVESAGRDEVMVEATADFEALTPQQAEWRTVADLFRGGNTQAFIARAGAGSPGLTFQTRQRATVETSGARIGLAQTVLVLDNSGAYRAALTCHVDNRTEQVLEIELPPGAELWTARVAGELVKPSIPDAAKPRRVHLPLVKTAAGDLDYIVEVKYGGRLAWPGFLQPVDFPLIRTVNINVELSQVELRLPQTRSWFDFGGTVREVKKAGEFAAGILSYQNKQAKRLLQTLQYGSEFEKARAGNNLWQISSTLSASTQSSVGGASDAYTTQVSQSASIIREAQVQMEQAKNAQADTAQEDNRSRLNGAFVQQYNTLARNKVIEGGKNWSDQSVVETGKQAQGGEAVNEAWLSNSKINAAHDTDDDGASDAKELTTTKAPVPGKPGKTGGKPQGKSESEQQQVFKLEQGQQQAAEPGMVQLGGQIGADLPQDKGKAQPLKLSGMYGGRTSANRQEMAQRYQQKLAKQTILNQPAVASPPSPTNPPMEINGVVADDSVNIVSGDGQAALAVTAADLAGRQTEAAASGGYSGGDFAPMSATQTPAPMAGGVTSLDAALPAFDPQRWARYQFTTPRGEISLQARAVARSLLDDLKRLGAALVLVLLLASLRLAAQRSWPLPAGGGRTVTRWLMAGGFLGLLIGVLPVYAALAFVGGLGTWIILTHSRLSASR